MKIGKKTAVTKEITRQERNKRNNIKRLTVSAIVAFILFICLTVIQSSILNQEEKKPVYQIKEDIPVGTKITEDNFDEFLSLKEVQLSLIPDQCITDKSIIVGKFVNRDYKAKDIITEDGLTDIEKLYKDNFENPVELSFSSDTLANASAGIIREGDYVNIYAMRKSTDNSGGSFSSMDNLYQVDDTFTFKHVYITKAFDGAGNRITTTELTDNSGSPIVATLFNIILDEKDADLFNETLKNCDIKVVKLLYDTDEDYEDFINKVNKDAGSFETSKKEETPVETEEDEPYFWELEQTYAEQAFERLEAENQAEATGTEELPADTIETVGEAPTESTETTVEVTDTTTEVPVETVTE